MPVDQDGVRLARRESVPLAPLAQREDDGNRARPASVRFGTLWSGLSMSLAGDPWQLSETRIGLFGIAGLTGALGALAPDDGRTPGVRTRSAASRSPS